MNMRTILFALLFGTLLFHSAFSATINSISVNSPADRTQVAQYSKIEFKVALTTSSTKFYEAVPASGGVDLSAVFTGPDASTWNIKGFYDGTNWLIRFAPTVTGAWTVAVSVTDAGGSGNSPVAGPGFTCVASNNPGFGQINGRFLRFSNQTAFYAIGHNNGWQYDVEQPSFTNMAAQGENLMSFWLATPWVVPTDNAPYTNRIGIENTAGGIGNYDQTACAYIDGVVGRAEAANVYLLPSIWAHDQLNDGTPTGWPSSWSNNAYSTLGITAKDFYTRFNADGSDTQQWHYQKNYYRYILARWGYSRSIVGWVGVVEIDGTTGFVNGTESTNWCGALRTFFAGNDKYRSNSGGAYPLVISRVDIANYNPGMDLTGTDSYASQTSNTTISSTLASETSNMRGLGKPCLFPEFGGYVGGGATEPTHMHNGIWAGTAAGDALCPLKWCDGGGWPLLTDATVGAGLRLQLQNLSQFVSALGYPIDNSLSPASLSVPGTGMQGWGMQRGDRGFGWIQNTNTNGTVGGQTFSVGSLSSGTYNVYWYDTWASGATPLSSQPQVVNVASGTLGAAVPTPPTARADIAFKFFINAPPTFQATAAATPNPVSGTTTALSVFGADDTGEANLSYHWALTGNPPATVTFSVNDSNAARNTVATFTKAGTYTFKVTLTDPAGATASSTVDVTVTSSLTATVAPVSAALTAGQQQQFTATIVDQFGTTFTDPLTWTVSGGGSIDQTGLFTAGPASGGPYTVTVADGNLSATASVVITDGAPVINSATATPATVTGTTTALAVSAIDDGGEPALTYVWALNSAPIGGTVTFSANNSNDAKNATATFTAPGDYVLGLTVTDAGQMSTATTVSVTVVPHIATVTVTPSAPIVASNGSQQFSASGVDQFGKPLNAALTWSVSGGGQIDATGKFTAQAAAGGPFTVTASSGGISGSATVSVTNSVPVLSSINAMVNTTSAALSTSAADDGGETNVIYAWSVFSAPPGGAALFSSNGTNAAKSTTVTFNATGMYSLNVTATDGAGLSTLGSTSITITAIVQPFAIIPASATMPVNGTLAFSTTAVDQFGHAVSAAWTTTTGKISAAGVLTAGAVPGNFSVTATVAGMSQSAAVTVAQGTLSGTIATPVTTSLSTEGTIDWAHWGSSNASSFDHKSGITPLISNVTFVSGGIPSAVSTGPSLTWTGGTPTAASTTSTSKTGIAVAGVNRGVSITVPASTTVQRMNVYVGVTKAKGTLTARLSDGSAVAYSDSTLTNQSGTTNREYSFQFAAVSSNATLIITWTAASTTGSNGAVVLYGATLGTGGLSGKSGTKQAPRTK